MSEIKRTNPAKYAIDWDDPHYPSVVLFEEGLHTTRYTFTEAKQEIINFYQNQIDFARIMIAQTRSLRARSIGRND